MIVVSLAALLALLAVAGWTLTSGRRGPAYLLFGLSVLWLFANAALEGPVLWSLDREHGLVLADLLTPAGVLLAGWRLWTLRGRVADRPPTPPRGDAAAIPVRSDRAG
jgi:hypothetical protein